MPTEAMNESMKEELKKVINEYEPEVKENSYEEEILEHMRQILQIMRKAKPEIRSERARRYAVAITEFEKVFAYFKVYILDFIDSD